MPGRYRCPYCPYSTDDYEAWNNHCQKEEQELQSTRRPEQD